MTYAKKPKTADKPHRARNSIFNAKATVPVALRGGCFTAIFLLMAGCSQTAQQADPPTPSPRQEMLQKTKSRCQLGARFMPVMHSEDAALHPAYDEDNPQHRVTHQGAQMDMGEYERCMKENWPDKYEALQKEEIKRLQKELGD